MDWNRIAGLWSEFQDKAAALGKGNATAQDKPSLVLRQFATATRPAAGMQDPLVRQMDYRQRMALFKREVEEVERELVRIRAVCADTREMFQRLDNSAHEAKKPGAGLRRPIR